MKKSVFIILILMAFPMGLVLGKDKLKSLVPLSVDSVMTVRSNNNLIRTILYSTESAQQLDVELINAPEMNSLIDKRTIKSISVQVNDVLKVLDFSNSAAVSINNIVIVNGFVKFEVEYFVRVGGGYYLSACEVDANNNSLKDAACQLQKQGL